MGVNKNLSKTERKHAYDKKLRKFLDEYSRVLIAEVGNVGSTQLAAIRRAIRGESEMLMGKNTLIRRCIKVHAEAIGNDKIKALIPLLHGNVGLIFTKADLKEVRDEVSKYKVAPIDVVVPPGKTGLDPSQTSFFQVLNIPTKINKGTVEIVSPVDLIKKGDKVGSSEAALLAKLGIRPFSYGLEITNVYDDGSVFSPEVLDLTDEDLIEKFASGVSMVASLSLAVSYPTMAAAPHMFLNGYKNVLAVAIETNYSYPQADEIKFYLQDINDSYAEPAVTNSGLSDLPPDIIEKLLNHGLCRRDWAHLRCTDKSLKAKVDNAKKPMQLPWLLLPSTTNPMYYITDEATHGLRLPNNVRKANRIAGAHEGDWIFLADDKEATPWKNVADDKKCTPSRNRLYNLTTGREIPLPDQIVCDGQRAAVSIRSATLAGSPDSPDGWVVVAIVTLPNTTLDRAAFCNKSMQLWEDRGHVSCQRFAEGEAYLPYDNDLLDVVYLDGSFYILTEDEEVMRLVCDANYIVHPGLGLHVKLRKDLPAEKQLEENGLQVWRYLVPLQTEILMVIRYIDGRHTTGVRVFRLAYNEDQTCWIELHNLPGHKLFIGHGCSRCFKDGDEELSVYFYDDREERVMIDYYFRDDSGMATLSEVSSWPVLTEGSQIERISERSPPAWWLHKYPSE